MTSQNNDPTLFGSLDAVNSSKFFIIAIVIIALGAIGWLVSHTPPEEPRGGSGGGSGAAQSDIDQMFQLNRTALTATESLLPDQAVTPWDALWKYSPNDASIARNRALNRILIVDELTKTATNASADKSDQKAARLKLSDAIDSARSSITEFDGTTDEQVLPMWMGVRVNLNEAVLLPRSLTKSKRLGVFERLVEAIEGPLGKDPRSNYLGGSLISVLEQMEDPLDGLPTPILKKATPALAALSDAHPENLFFALRAARLCIDRQDSSATRFVERASGLTEAIKPSIAMETKKLGITPEGLVNDISTSVQSGDFSKAGNRMMLWLNVLNSSEILKTDRRRASPHPLDLLSFDSLRRLSFDAAQKAPIEKSRSKLTFEPRNIASEESVRSMDAVDYDLDLDEDLLITQGKFVRLLTNDGNGGFSDPIVLPPIDSVDSDIRGVLFADLFIVDSSNPARIRRSGTAIKSRHDTFMTIVAYGDWGAGLVSIDAREKTPRDQRLKWVDSSTGLEDLSGVLTAVAGDLEADGDLDLVFATKNDGVRLFVNRGNRTFFELQSTDRQFGKTDPVSAITIADLDRDLDLDLVTTHASGKVGMLENLLHLQFRGRMIEEIPVIAGASSLTVEDVDGNVSWDLIITGKESVAVVFSHTADSGVWTVEHVETHSIEVDSTEPGAIRTGNMQVADLDNDSWFELILGQRVYRLGPWGIADPISIDSSQGNPRVVASDFTGDGGIDLAFASASGIELAVNKTDPMGHRLSIRFKGIDDNVSGRVNHFAIGTVLETRFGPHYRARIVRSPSTHFGIDGVKQASSVRAIMPNGLTQVVRDPKTDSLVEEEQTLKGSCPYLYAWDGEKFVFVTDCLWAAPLGLQVASGVVAKDRPWEYLKIDGSMIRPQGDHYEFRITEELWEVAYFDKISITAVDHPPEVEIHTNEKVGPAEIAKPTVFEFERSATFKPTKAVDTLGADVTERLAEKDARFVKGFERRLRQGLCPPHWIDLTFDLPQDKSSDPTYLVLTGWILPTDTSLNIQIDQNPDLMAIEFPSLWVPESDKENGNEADEAKDAEHGWRKAIPFIGFPGGKTKTIVVDVSQLVAEGHRRFRIRTSAQIYWDAAELGTAQWGTGQDAPRSRLQPLRLVSAEVAVHGFSRRIQPGGHRPETYDYQTAQQGSRWPPLRGKLTQLGGCVDLVQEWDDQMVVISSGDEIRLQFEKPSHDPPEGWVRDFIVHSVGWDKDADLNTLAGQAIDPLPYREMSSYPPGASETKRHEKIVELNAVHRSREHVFRRFWYRGGQAPTMWPAKESNIATVDHP